MAREDGAELHGAVFRGLLRAAEKALVEVGEVGHAVVAVGAGEGAGVDACCVCGCGMVLVLGEEMWNGGRDERERLTPDLEQDARHRLACVHVDNLYVDVERDADLVICQGTSDRFACDDVCSDALIRR